MQKPDFGDGYLHDRRLGGRGGRNMLDLGRLQLEPEKGVRPEAERIRMIADRWKHRATEQLDRHRAPGGRKIQLDMLYKPRKIGDDQNLLIVVAADEGQNLAVRRVQKFERAAAKSAEPLAQRNQPLHPPQERVGVVLLRLDVARLVVV